MSDKASSDDLPDVGHVEYAVRYHWPSNDVFVVERREALARFDNKDDAMVYVAEANASSRKEPS